MSEPAPDARARRDGGDAARRASAVSEAATATATAPGPGPEPSAPRVGVLLALPWVLRLR